MQKIIESWRYSLIFGISIGCFITYIAPPPNNAWSYPWMIIHVLPIIVSGFFSGSFYYYNFTGYLLGALTESIIFIFILRSFFMKRRNNS
jgi:O-antigen/teichoic acid export membrane protein